MFPVTHFPRLQLNSSQSANISRIDLTWLVSQRLKSDWKRWHPANIPCIHVTRDVSQRLKSPVNKGHPENIKPIDVTPLVSQLLRPSPVSILHPLNRLVSTGPRWGESPSLVAVFRVTHLENAPAQSKIESPHWTIRSIRLASSMLARQKESSNLPPSTLTI